MNNDLISRSALLETIDAEFFKTDPMGEEQLGFLKCMRIARTAPAVDVVSPGVLEQYKWERDTAIAQLEELGIGFGQKKPDMVEVVRCKDCVCSMFTKFSKGEPVLITCTHKNMFPLRVMPEFYCAYGERKMDAEVHDDA